MKLKLTKLSITLILIQTLLTLGLNWVYFLMYYAIEKNAIDTEREVFRLHRKSKLKTISLVFYGLMMFILSAVVVLNIYHPYFILTSLSDNLAVIKEHLYLVGLIFVLSSVIIFKLLQFILCGIYYELTRKGLYPIGFISSVILFIGRIFLLGLYELYFYLINKKIYQKDYRISRFGQFSLLFLVTTTIINILTVFINISFVPTILPLIVLIVSINPFLNYGLYELKLKLILKGNLSLLSQGEKETPTFRFNKAIYSFVVMAVLLFIVHISVVVVRNTTKESLDINTAELTCTGEICYKEEPETLSNYYLVNHYQDIDCTGTNIDCSQIQERIKNITYRYQNADKISLNPIKYTNKYANENDNTVYKAEGVYDIIQLRQFRYYLYVETYYKKLDDNQFMPLFNIIKNFNFSINIFDREVEENAELTELNYSINYFQNYVLIYSFLDNTLKPYSDENYSNIDLSRLTLEHFNLEVKAEENNFAAFDLLDYSTPSVPSMSTFDHWTKGYIFSLFDPFMIHSLGFNFTLLNTNIGSESQINSIIDAKTNSDFDIDNIQYPFDTQYIVLRNSNLLSFEYVNDHKATIKYGFIDIDEGKFYKYNQGVAGQCVDQCLSDIEFKQSMDLQALPEQYRILYTDQQSLFTGSIKDVTFYVKSTENIDALVTFEVKTVQQLFKGENLFTESIRVDSYGLFDIGA